MAGATSDAGVSQLQLLYPQLPKDVLRGVLAACSGNVERAAAMLVQMMSESTRSSTSKATKSKAAAAVGGVPPLADGSARSTTELYGEQSSTCGYCHGPRKTSITYGVVCEQLNAQDYQTMIDLGWRRSGDYLYKQRNSESCCCHYTIRLNVHKYAKSKAQRQAINRFERFLRGEAIGAAATAEGEEAQQGDEPMSDATPSKPPQSASDPHAERVQQALLAAVQALLAAGKLPATLVPDSFAKQLRVYPYAEPTAKKGNKKESSAAAGAPAAATVTDVALQHPPFQYSSNLALVLSGLLRKQKQDGMSAVAIAQLIAQQLSDVASAELASASAASSSPQPIQAFVAEPLGYLNFHIAGAEPVRKQSISHDKAAFTAKAGGKAAAAAAAAAASAASAPGAAAASAAGSAPAGPAHTFEVRQVDATFDPQAFEVYKHYQMRVHGDKESKLTPASYTRFLCSSPLVKTGPYGGFHHHYLLDGRLIAVGVVDILPSCLSSVYLFYLPEYDFLNLGTVTAVKEIEWMQRRLTPNHPQLKYYYMGYYIHSCAKMRYKAKFAPSDLLCPVRCTWHPLAECVAALDSLQATMPPAQSGAGRCVILSDVARESREEDGAVPRYSAPSMTLRLEAGADTAGATPADGNKKKRKKKKKKAKIAAGTAASSHTADDDEEGEDDEEGGDDGSKASAAVAGSSAAAAATASAAAANPSAASVAKSTTNSNSAAAPSTSAAAASAASAASAPRPAPRVVVSASSPYVFDSAVAQSVAAQRQSMAQACVGSIPLLIQQRLLTLGQLTAQGQRQVRAPLLEWAARVGTELAQRVAVKFG